MGLGNYILRVWLEPSAQHTWRASVTDLQTNDKQYFSTPDALIHFLSGQLGGVSVTWHETSEAQIESSFSSEPPA
jgi:hypothetical protein